MKGLQLDDRPSRRTFTRTEVILGSIIIFLLVRLYFPFTSSNVTGGDHDKKIFICHAPQPSLLNDHNVDYHAFKADIEFANMLLQGLVDGGSGYGDAADSVTFSVFLPNGSPIFEAGFGKLRANETESRAPDGNSIYRMASITKMFTTAEILLQRQRGQVSLDQDVSTILDDFKPSTKNWNGVDEPRLVTVKQLLSHTSGILRDESFNFPWPSLPNNSFDGNVSNLRSPSREQLMKRIHEIPSVMPAETIPIYSNIGFDVAGWVAEAIGKMNYTELLYEDIFKPLKMYSSSFKRQSHLLQNVAVPAKPFSYFADWEMDAENPAGGMYCSAADLRRFGQDLLGRGLPLDQVHKEDTKDKSLFTKLTTREWLRPIHVFDDNLLSTGLAWEIFTIPAGTRRMSLYTKGGTYPAYHTLFGIDPEREFGFSLLISGEPTGNVDLAMRLVQRFAATIDDQRQRILAKEFAGSYIGNKNDKLKIEVIDGGLGLTEAVVNGTDLFKLMRLGEDEGDYVALWPTGTPEAWRLAIGRPPAVSYGGCMYKFASIDSAYSSHQYPIDLLIIGDGKISYGAVNQTFHRQ